MEKLEQAKKLFSLLVISPIKWVLIPKNMLFSWMCFEFMISILARVFELPYDKYTLMGVVIANLIVMSLGSEVKDITINISKDDLDKIKSELDK